MGNKEVKDSVFEVEQVVTQSQPVIRRGDDDVEVTELLVEIANDIKELKAAVLGK